MKKQHHNTAQLATEKQANSIALSNTEEQAKLGKKDIEIGGRKEGLEPTRYGDWEYKGRCIDF